MHKVQGVSTVGGPEFEASTQIGLAVRRGDTANKGDIAKKAAGGATLKKIIADAAYKTLIEIRNFLPRYRCSIERRDHVLRARPSIPRFFELYAPRGMSLLLRISALFMIGKATTL
ncbi:hypothetical protein ACF1BQ_030820 [Bradyrhizobium sp. RDT10]